MLALDTHANNVLRSDDDGKTWAEVKGVPPGKAWDITEHPFDNKRAFIFGDEKDHWYTKDRGAKWSKFTAELFLAYTQPPLVFHAKNKDWILYSGRECADDDPFGAPCKEVVGLTPRNSCAWPSDPGGWFLDILHEGWIPERHESFEKRYLWMHLCPWHSQLQKCRGRNYSLRCQG